MASNDHCSASRLGHVAAVYRRRPPPSRCVTSPTAVVTS